MFIIALNESDIILYYLYNTILIKKQGGAVF